MKIISKYKDYYDYLQGIYGVDEKLVLDRRKGEAKPSVYGKFCVYIGGRFIEGYCKDDVIYLGDRIVEIQDLSANYWYRSQGAKHIIPTGKYLYDRIYYPHLSEDTLGIYKDFKTDVPLVLIQGVNNSQLQEFPCLEYLGINKVIGAHEIWTSLSAFLGQQITKKEPEQPIGNDKTRILSHGFDIKKSFRHRKE